MTIIKTEITFSHQRVKVFLSQVKGLRQKKTLVQLGGAPLATEKHQLLPEKWIKAVFDIQSHSLVTASCPVSPSVQ